MNRGSPGALAKLLQRGRGLIKGRGRVSERGVFGALHRGAGAYLERLQAESGLRRKEVTLPRLHCAPMELFRRWDASGSSPTYSVFTADLETLLDESNSQSSPGDICIILPTLDVAVRGLNTWLRWSSNIPLNHPADPNLYLRPCIRRIFEWVPQAKLGAKSRLRACDLVREIQKRRESHENATREKRRNEKAKREACRLVLSRCVLVPTPTNCTELFPHSGMRRGRQARSHSVATAAHPLPMKARLASRMARQVYQTSCTRAPSMRQRNSKTSTTTQP